jgi:sporulation protein YlmC with PRC-barrel domain
MLFSFFSLFIFILGTNAAEDWFGFSQISKPKLIIYSSLPMRYQPISSTGGEWAFTDRDAIIRYLSVSPYLFNSNIHVHVRFPTKHDYFCPSSHFDHSEYNISPDIFDYSHSKTFTINSYDKIFELKTILGDYLKCEPVKIRLLHNGKCISDSKTFYSYNISHNSTLYLVFELSGGSKSKEKAEEEMKGMDIENMRLHKEIEEMMENYKLLQEQLNTVQNDNQTLRNTIDNFSSLPPSSPLTPIYTPPTYFSKESKEPGKNIPPYTPYKPPSSFSSSSSISSSSSLPPSLTHSTSPNSSFKLASSPSGILYTHSSKIDNSIKGAKPIKLNNISLYDGKSEFKEWFSLFNMKMQAGNHPEQVRLSTLIDYLTLDLQKLVAEMDPSVSASYPLLVESLHQAFRKLGMNEAEVLSDISNILQGESEVVMSFAARLLGKVKDLSIPLSDEAVTSFFLNGLRSEVLLITKPLLRDKSSFEHAQIAAAEAEIIVEQAKTRATKSSGINGNISSIPNVNNNNNTTTSYNSSNNNIKKCNKCNLNVATPGKSMCNFCFSKSNNNRNNNYNNKNFNLRNNTYFKGNRPNGNNSNNNNNNNNNIDNYSLPPPINSPSTIDYTLNKVKYIPFDNNNNNPLYWDNLKLVRERKCVYCAQPMNADHPCKSRYPFYNCAEVRTLLIKGISVPQRSGSPGGPPLSPP